MTSKVYFDEVAGQWDEMRASFFPESVRDGALARAGVQAGQAAADVGAGSGFLTEALIHAGLRVVAIDQSEAMLDIMRQKFPNAAVDYRAGTFERLPLEAGEVDYAFANMYLHHVEDPAQAIQEMARIVKHSGALIITDLATHHHQWLIEEHHDRWMGFAREAVTQWFVDAGLTEIEVTDAGCNCCATSACGTCSSTISIFRAIGRKPA